MKPTKELLKKISGKKIVCLGGGNAMPKAILKGIKKYPVEISAICAMLDTGGSSGRLKKDYKITSPGDIRRSLIALANTSPVIEHLFNYRFQGGDLKGHNFANLLITALELNTNNYDRVIKELKKILQIRHQVLPVTLSKSNLYAILENGKIISGEKNIDNPRHDGNLKIKKVYLKPKAKAYPKTIKAIKKADLIIIGPGDLYSSLAQILLTEGISESIKKSKAKKIYVCNLMQKYGETNEFSVSDFTEEIEKYLDSKLDYVIYNNKIPSEELMKKQKEKNPELLGMVKLSKDLKEEKFIGKSLLKRNSTEHNTEKLAKLLIGLI
jgi:uncharacterized cofD-like protein